MWHLVRADSMFRPLLIAVLLALWAPGAAGQAQGVLRIRITLTDAEGRPAPVAQHRLLISDNPATTSPREVVTSREGSAVITLPPGNYTIESDKPLVVGSKAYSWWKTLDVPAGRETVVELTEADAEVGTPGETSTVPDAPPDEGTVLLAKWQGSVVELWMPRRHATGFLVDARGLVATSQRVVEVAPVVEGTTVGAAHLAGLAVGAHRGWDDIADAWAPRAVVEPARVLDRDRWRDAVERSRRWYPELSAIDF